MTDSIHTAVHPFRDTDGKNIFAIGSNYWPGHAGLNMWSDWQPEKIRTELEKMIDLGFNIHRSFLFMPDFVPTSTRVEPVMLERLAEYLDLCDKIGIGAILSFFVGHMSGEDWDVPWRGNRNFYADEELLKIQEMYVSKIVETCHQSDSIFGWILSNEIPNYEPRGTAEQVENWARRIRDCIRSIDEAHPISIGDGCWSPEVSRRLDHFQLRKLSGQQDFLGLHFYPISGNPWHQSFTAAFRLAMSRFWHNQVIIEEFGLSTAMCSEKNQAIYYQDVLYSSLINGSKGAMNWCFSDFDLPLTRPYSHHPHELRFGLQTTEGRLRPAGKIMQAFSGIAGELTNEGWQQISIQPCSLWIPSNYYYGYPYDWDNEFTDWYNLYLNTFTLLKRTNLNPQCIFEPAIELENNGVLTHELNMDSIDGQVLFLPRLKRITAESWEKIKKFAWDGGVVYISFAHDAWVPDWEAFLGIESNVNFGIPAYRNWNKIEVRSVHENGKPIGSIAIGSPSIETAFCPILNCHGEVIYADQEDHPLLIKNPTGRGTVFFSPYPLEMMALHHVSSDTENVLKKIYRGIHESLPHTTDIMFDGEDVEIGLWQSPDQKKIKVILLNHAWEERTARLRFPDSTRFNISDNQVEYCLSAKTVLAVEILKAD